MSSLARVSAVAIVASGALIAVSPYPARSVEGTPIAVRLTAAEVASASHSDDLGDGVALIMGPSGMPTPPQSYLDAVNSLYLEQLGFTGTPEAQTTIELPAFTALSTAIGARQLTAGIKDQIANGDVDADHPVVVFGYSQSSALSTFTMEQLHADGIPSEDVHFVLVGDSAAPNGGILTSFNPFPGGTLPIPSLDLELGNSTPSDLYPTDVYTLEYDGYADFPHYPVNLLSDLNAVMGMFWEHEEYLGLSPEQIAGATELDTTADSLNNFYMIPSEYLPILEPLMLYPVIGKPLYDLLEPDMRILVNLGYGDIDHGWNDGPADVETPVGLFPTDLDWGEVGDRLVQGAQQGFDDMVDDLNDPATYQLTPIVDNPVLEPLLTAAYNAGFISDPDPDNLLDLLGSVSGFPNLLPSLEELPQLLSDAIGAFGEPVNFGFLLSLLGL